MEKELELAVQPESAAVMEGVTTTITTESYLVVRPGEPKLVSTNKMRETDVLATQEQIDQHHADMIKDTNNANLQSEIDTLEAQKVPLTNALTLDIVMGRTPNPQVVAQLNNLEDQCRNLREQITP